MEGLETAEVIGKTVTKAFDHIDSEKKEEGFNNLIDQIEECNIINTLRNQRNSLTEDQKLKIYKRHSINLGTRLRYTSMNTPGLQQFAMGEKIYHGVKNYKKEGKENAIKNAILEEIPFRFLIQLGIIDKPQGLTNDKLKEDIKKDAKNFNLYLGLCKTICTVVPGAQEALPFIGMAKHYTKWYKKEGANYVIDRLNSKKESDIKAQTNKELSIAMSDIQDKAA